MEKLNKLFEQKYGASRDVLGYSPLGIPRRGFRC